MPAVWGRIFTSALPKDEPSEEWLKYLYAKMVAKDPQLPSYDALKEMGIYKRKDPNGHFVAYKKFRDDPQANPLKTPSGKIEIYSSQLAKSPVAGSWKKDEVISPLPVYASTFEGWDSPARSQFPPATVWLPLQSAYPLKLRQH